MNPCASGLLSSPPGHAPAPPSARTAIISSISNSGSGSGSGGGSPRTLYGPSDDGRLSDLLCLARQQIEAFAATPQDIAARARRGGPTQHLTVGTVGIRCVHCAHLPVECRAKGSISYPPSTRLIYQSVRNWQRYHWDKCEEMPRDVKDRYRALKDKGGGISSKTSKEYWIESCKRMGMRDAPDGSGIFFVEQQRSCSVSEAAAGNNPNGIGAPASAALASSVVGGAGAGSGTVSFSSVPDAVAAMATNPAATNPATTHSNNNVLPPAFTAQDDMAELQTLHPAELARAEADLRGITLGLSAVRIDDQDTTEEEREDWRTEQLYRLDLELERIPLDRRAAYLQAVAMCPELVNDERKLAFLRREGFEASHAAERLVRYWVARLNVFGAEKCFVPLTLGGAMADEVDDMLRYNPIHVMPVWDVAGRAILVFDPSRLDLSKYSTRSAMMAFWYIAEAVAEDPQVSEQGIVMLGLADKLNQKNFDIAYQQFLTCDFWAIAPVACRSIHACQPNPFAYYVLHPVMKRLLGKENRLRTKIHYGTTEEVLSELESYCLPRDRLPAELGGDIVLDLEKWMHDRFLLENQRG